MDLFSERHGYRQRSGELIFEDAPEQVRVGLREVLAQCGYSRPGGQRNILCKALRVQPDPQNWSEYPNIDIEVDWLIQDHSQPWYRFYDMCERLYRALPETDATSDENDAEVFQQGLNQLFREEYVGYRMVEGKIEKVGSEEFHQAVAEASHRMSEPRFEVPMKQFKKALAFRSLMPPDYANAVKEAVNSLEGTWQIVTKKPGTSLPQILTGLEPALPRNLKNLCDALYGYGCGSEGARHAGVGGHVPGPQECELIVHVCAAAIAYATQWRAADTEDF